MIVRADGTLARVRAERLVYSEATAHLFEQAEIVRYPVAGGLALEPVVERGWATYNFEVEGLHTYIADGWRVHNDSQATIDVAGQIGQYFGTQLAGMLTEGENQFTQLAAGTALGLVASDLAKVITDTGFHLFIGPQHDFGASLSTAMRQLEHFDWRAAGAVAGTVSSFLTAELGEALGVEGFGAQLFNVAAGSYAGSVLSTAAVNAVRGDPLLQGADFTKALEVSAGAVGTFFGSALAQKILPAQSVEGTIGGSLGSIAGSALGSAALGTTIGGSLGLLGNFLLPGIGGFFGTLIGTFLGDLFADEPDPRAAIDLFLKTGPSGDRGGTLDLLYQWKATDGFDGDATDTWAKAVHDLTLQYGRVVGGFDYANAYVTGLEFNQALINNYGMRQGDVVRILQQMHVETDDDDLRYYVNGRRVDNVQKMVDGAIAGFIKGAQVIGGDILLKRAAANSLAPDTPTLSGDMAVAEQYTKYLNERDVINPLIAADPKSIFTAGWAVTLAQANDLKLAKTNIADFHGGMGGFLASLAYAGVSVAPSDVTISRDGNGKVSINVKVDADFVVPGVIDVFAEKAELIDQSGQRVLRLTYANSMTGVGYNNVTGTTAGSGGMVEVTGETTGRDIWFAANNGGHVVLDSADRYIEVGDREIISSDDIFVGAGGNDRLSGAEGWDWIAGGGGNDTLDGGSEADVLLGGDGNDTLTGGEDLDYLEGGAGADTLNGGQFKIDWDTAGYAASNAAVAINLAAGTASGGHAAGDRLTNIANLVGSRYNDQLVGDQDGNVLEGGAGADVLDGGGAVAGAVDFAAYFRAHDGVTASLADARLNTGDAAGDTYRQISGLQGSAFADTLYGDAQDNKLWGQGGDDLLVVGAGKDEAIGAFGFDTMSYRTLTYGITINLQNWSSSSAVVADDAAIGVEAFEGTNDNDTLIGRSTQAPDGGLSPNDVLLGYGGNDTISGNDGRDYLYGGTGEDDIAGGNDNDVLSGEAGNDVLGGGNGDDTLGGGKDNDKLYGEAGNDVLSGDDGNDTLKGDEGNDKLIGGAGNDTLKGDANDDWLDGGLGADIFEGGAGIDTVSYAKSSVGVAIKLWEVGSGGDADGDTYLDGIERVEGSAFADRINGQDTVGEVLIGGEGNDELAGNGGDDRLFGEGGNDLLNGGTGSDKLDGGSGYDTVSYADRTTSVVVALNGAAEVTARVGGAVEDTLIGVENLAGGSANDTLTGDGLGNALDGNAGNDTLRGGAGDDVLTGGAGADTLEGGSGFDTVIYAGSSAGVTVKLWMAGAGGDAQGDTYADAIERVIGSSYADEIRGQDRIAETLIGGAGNDLIFGGAGDDVLVGNDGRDTLDGGDGVDTADYTDRTAAVVATLNGASNATVRVGGAADDTLRNVENLVGGSAGDTLTGDGLGNRLRGGAGDDVLVGGAGADTLEGGAGFDTVTYAASGSGVTVKLWLGGTGGDAQGDTYTDAIERVVGSGYADELRGQDIAAETLVGGAGNDTLAGGGGDDTLEGGAGADAMEGGAGSDTVSYAGSAAGVTVKLWLGGTGGDAQGDTYADAMERVVGSEFGDVLVGQDSVGETLIGGGGNDELAGNGGADTLYGEGGNDLLAGGAGADVLDGGVGFDTADYSDKVAAVVATLNGATNATVRVGGAAEDTIRNIENLIGGAGNDTLAGDGLGNTLTGGAGNDTLRGAAGDDTFVFKPGFGRDIISDFATAGTAEVIQIDHTIFADYAALAAAAVQSGADTVITADANTTLTLKNVALSSLQSDDFRFA